MRRHRRPGRSVRDVLRISGRLGWTHPYLAGFITTAGLELLHVPRGLAPRALRDIKDGQSAGRFTGLDPQVALAAVAGGLMGLLRLHQRSPDRIDETAVDRLAEAILRMLGIPDREARRIAARALPGIGAW